jgi:DNA-binding CsgD family transcriptional regulator
MSRPPPTAVRADAHPRASLTGRDLEALHHLAAGRSTAAIAAAMSITTNTVRTRIHRLQNMLGAPARERVVSRASALGLLDGWDGSAGSRGDIPPQRQGDQAADRTRCGKPGSDRSPAVTRRGLPQSPRGRLRARTERP